MFENNWIVISVLWSESGSNSMTPRGKCSEIACHARRRSGTRSQLVVDEVSQQEVRIVNLLCVAQRVNESWRFFDATTTGVDGPDRDI